MRGGILCTEFCFPVFKIRVSVRVIDEIFTRKPLCAKKIREFQLFISRALLFA